MSLRPRRFGIMLAATFSIAALNPAAAHGSPIDDKRAEAQRLQGQIDANGDHISALGEQYNGAVFELEQANTSIADAQRRFAVAEAQTRRIQSHLNGRAVALYKHAGDVQTLPDSDIGDLQINAAREKYATAAANRDSAVIDQLRQSKEELALRRQELDGAKQAAEADKARITTARERLEQLNVEQQRLLDKTKGELAQLIREEQARREAEARRRAAQEQARLAAARARLQAGPARSPARGRNANLANVALPEAPAPSPGAAAAIEYARAQLGKPYVYAAAGPDTFDCSGLTMMAWRAGGVSMPHYSGAQFQTFPHVALDQLQPGDLVFKGPGGSAHVALYVGGGMQIAATHTGDFVKLQPVPYDRLSGAVRPG